MPKHPSSIEFHRTLREIGERHDTKARDYSGDHDPFANVKAAAAFGVEPWVGAVIRANDKLTRIQRVAQRDAPADESAEKALLDVAVYAVIALVLYRESINGGPDQDTDATQSDTRHAFAGAAAGTVSGITVGSHQFAYRPSEDVPGGAEAGMDDAAVPEPADADAGNGNGISSQPFTFDAADIQRYQAIQAASRTSMGCWWEWEHPHLKA